jgi:hypothetical protein
MNPNQIVVRLENGLTFSSPADKTSDGSREKFFRNSSTTIGSSGMLAIDISRLSREDRKRCGKIIVIK